MKKLRGFCCSTTKLFFGAGVLLFASGFLFCDLDYYWVRAKTIKSETETTIPITPPERRCTHDSSCKVPLDTSVENSNINVQQQEIQKRLGRISLKIEKLKEKRRRTKDARNRRKSRQPRP